LSNELYQQGLQRIEAALRQAEARDEILVFETYIQILMLSGLKSE
jgi:hypothetical protein